MAVMLRATEQPVLEVRALARILPGSPDLAETLFASPDQRAGGHQNRCRSRFAAAVLRPRVRTGAAVARCAAAADRDDARWDSSIPADHRR